MGNSSADSSSNSSRYQHKLNRISLVLTLTQIFSLYIFFCLYGIRIVRCIRSPKPPRHQGSMSHIAFICHLQLIGSIPPITISFIITSTASSSAWLTAWTIAPVISAGSGSWYLYTRLLTAEHPQYEDYDIITYNIRKRNKLYELQHLTAHSQFYHLVKPSEPSAFLMALDPYRIS